VIGDLAAVARRRPAVGGGLPPAPPERRQIVAATGVALAVTLLAIGLLTPVPALEPTVAALLAIVLFLGYRTLLSWPTLIVLLVVVILVIPVRRYTLPGGLPFELEPYRLLLAIMFVGWFGALLVDRRVMLRRSGLEAPLLLLVTGIVGSLVANAARVSALEADVVKTLTFFLSFLLVFWLVVSVVRTYAVIDLLIGVFVVGGTVLAVMSVVESRTGYNPFNQLASWLPILELTEVPRVQGRGARLRAYASAEHAIALAAVLVMLVPLAVYLARRTGRRLWLLAAALMVLGALATVSRTGVVMLLVVAFVMFRLRPRETRRVLPALLPLLIVVHVAIPSTLGSLKSAFFPEGGLVAEQQAAPGTYGSGRLADLGPSLEEFGETPLFGQGFGTRITEWERANAPILDNQWLGLLLETGAIGAFAFAWLILRSTRRLRRAARADSSPRGWLFAGLAASTSAYGVGMFTYDALAFVQVTFVFFFVLALGAAALRADPET
jgi:O-antigen ligase